MFSPSKISINGKINSNDSSLFVSVFSPSFQFGLNVFEGIRIYKEGKKYNAFLIDQHIERLITSAKLLYFDDLPNKDRIKKDILNLLDSSSINEDIYLKYMFCFLDNGDWSRHDKPDRVCFFYPLKSTFRENTPRIISAGITNIERINNKSMPPKIKCGANYINSRLGYLEVNKKNTNNTKKMPIFLDSLGYVTESSGSCIFVIKDNIISTPKTQFSILPSITRLFLLKILKENLNGYLIQETTIDRWELFNADSLFLVGTNIELLFIKDLDHKIYNTSLKINQKIFEIFKNEVINV
tara:strand:- start:6087 stop:6977 length:891 start_codon:yes stop_codon:yes gene_type:complete